MSSAAVRRAAGRGGGIGAVGLLLASLAGCGTGRSLEAYQRFDQEVGGDLRARLRPISPADRRDYLRAAQLWLPGEVEQRDLVRGPPGPGALDLDQEARCDFVEPRADRLPSSGKTAKFVCRFADGEAVVKYGRENRELYAEVIGSRLLWALGFGADRLYPVRLSCRGCPADPWGAYRRYPRSGGGDRAERRFARAVVKRHLAGATIEACPTIVGGRCRARKIARGWAWDELAQVDPAKGGAPRAHVDALRLLAGFMQHGDNAPQNQRLLCLPEGIGADGGCTRPFLLIEDTGATFGGGPTWFGTARASARASLAAWAARPVWRDPARCQVELRSGRLRHPLVSEAGRRFLAGLLERLSQRQLRDLFQAAGVEALREPIDDGRGGTRLVKVADWVAVFVRKREEIARARCPR